MSNPPRPHPSLMDDPELRIFEPVSLRETISYGLGDAGFNLYWAPVTAFLMLYLTDVAGISAAAAGTFFVILRLVSAVADPIFGAIADRTQTTFGRYRPWFLWLAMPLAAAGIMAFSIAIVPPGGKLIAVYISIIGLNLIYTAANVAYNALSGVITPDATQRGHIMSARFGGAFLSAVFLTWLTPKLVAYAGHGNEALGWQFAMTLYGVAAVAIFINLFLQTRERVLPPTEPNPSPLADIRDLFRNRPWGVLFALALVVMIGFTLHTAATPYYIKYVGGRADLVTGFSMIFTLGLAIGSAVTSSLTLILSQRRIIALMLSAGGLTSLGLYLCPSGQIVLMFALQALCGVTFGVVSTLTFTMYADTADYNALKTDRRATAMTYSMIQFAKKIGAAIAAALLGWAMTATGYVANTQASGELLGNIRLMIGMVPAICVFTGIAIIRFYDLNSSAMAKLRFEAAERRFL